MDGIVLFLAALSVVLGALVMVLAIRLWRRPQVDGMRGVSDPTEVLACALRQALGAWHEAHDRLMAFHGSVGTASATHEERMAETLSGGAAGGVSAAARSGVAGSAAAAPGVVPFEIHPPAHGLPE